MFTAENPKIPEKNEDENSLVFISENKYPYFSVWSLSLFSLPLSLSLTHTHTHTHTHSHTHTDWSIIYLSSIYLSSIYLSITVYLQLTIYFLLPILWCYFLLISTSGWPSFTLKCSLVYYSWEWAIQLKTFGVIQPVWPLTLKMKAEG